MFFTNHLQVRRRNAKSAWTAPVRGCWEHGGAPAYWPWMQVVRAAGGELLEYLPTTPTAADPEAARFMLFDAVGQFLREAADSGPVLVVLDDLHAADAPSLLLLRFLAQTATDERLVIVGAYRDAEPRVHELADLFGRPGSGRAPSPAARPQPPGGGRLHGTAGRPLAPAGGGGQGP